jgi:hypothetical protein
VTGSGLFAFEGCQAAERDRQLAAWRRMPAEANWQPVGVARVQGARAFAVETDAAMRRAERKAACDVKITEGNRICHVGRLEVRTATPLLLSVPNRMVVGQAFPTALAIGYAAESLKDAVVRWWVFGNELPLLEEEARARSAENVLRAPAVAAPAVAHIQAELFAGARSLGREKAEVVFLPANRPVVSLTPDGMQLNGRLFIPLCMCAGRTVIASHAARGINSLFLGIGRDQATAADEALRAYVDSHASQGCESSLT